MMFPQVDWAEPEHEVDEETMSTVKVTQVLILTQNYVFFVCFKFYKISEHNMTFPTIYFMCHQISGCLRHFFSVPPTVGLDEK